jgi:hypothetical protein
MGWFSFLQAPRRAKRRHGTRPLLRVKPLEDRTLPSVTVGTNFTALAYSNSGGYSPPDTNAAVGPNNIVETVNSEIAIYDTSGNLQSKHSLTSFFAPVHAGSFVFDPQISYDDIAGRFVITALEQYTFPNRSYLDLAVSNDSNAADGFTEMHRINVQQGAGTSNAAFGDYDKLGWNNDAYVVTMNMFGFNTSSFLRVQQIAIDKSSVLDANNSTFTDYKHNLSASAYFTVVPARMHGSVAGDPMWYVEYGNSTSVSVVQETNILTHTPTFTRTNITVPKIYSPVAAVQLGGGKIDTGDTRILGVVWRNGDLAATEDVGTGGANSVTNVRWYEFSTTGTRPTLLQEGNINPGAGVDTYYGAIEIDASGNLGLTYMESSATEYMSMYVTGQLVGGPSGVMQTPALAMAGQANYSDFTGSPYRAGDYSGIGVDPVTGSFWASSEYATSATSDNWGTEITSFTLS